MLLSRWRYRCHTTSSTTQGCTDTLRSIQCKTNVTADDNAMFHANTAHVRTSGQYITQASYTTMNSMHTTMNSMYGNSSITLNSNMIQRRRWNVTMCDDEWEWVYVQVLQRLPGLDIYRAGQAGYDEHARTPDICDEVMTVTRQAHTSSGTTWWQLDDDGWRGRFTQAQEIPEHRWNPHGHPGRTPKCSTRSNVCVVRCVCLRSELWDREQQLKKSKISFIFPPMLTQNYSSM